MGETLISILCIIGNILSVIGIILSSVVLYRGVIFENTLTNEYMKQIKRFFNFSIGIAVFTWLVTLNKTANLTKSILYINAVGWALLFISCGIIMIALNVLKHKASINHSSAVNSINQSISLFVRNAVISIFLAWFIGI